jgi:hypothetical protein
MVAESLVILSIYWPQTISVSEPVYTEESTSWKVTSNNAVNLHFSDKVNNLKLSGWGSISGDTIMPNDAGTFTVSIDKDNEVILTVSASEQMN